MKGRCLEKNPSLAFDLCCLSAGCLSARADGRPDPLTEATRLLATVQAANAITLLLLLNDFIMVEPPTELWFTPSRNGLIGSGLVMLAGLALYVYRKNGKT